MRGTWGRRSFLLKFGVDVKARSCVTVINLTLSGVQDRSASAG